MTRLGQSTLDAAERLTEARDILKRILSNEAALEHLPAKDLNFLDRMERHIAEYGDNSPISPTQLFWLRDIWGRI